MKNMDKVLESYRNFQKLEKEVFENLLRVHKFLGNDIKRTIKSLERVRYCYSITGEDVFLMIQPKITKDIEKLKKVKAEFEKKEGFKIEYNTFKKEGYGETTVPELTNTVFEYGKNVTMANFEIEAWENSD